MTNSMQNRTTPSVAGSVDPCRNSRVALPTVEAMPLRAESNELTTEPAPERLPESLSWPGTCDGA